ncbi:hypothetical protein IW140_004805 [Coemansia sp. RSA 1813]|nr:hypothetical protein EV178_004868 [Coemansia sp. RSA 1646]KAJ1768716.1 hypothetical protein LPJ74_004642 [Coemansia sp. RSA 1843]KAJ2088837.1 hypothetical protein IW138_003909 [Coemansia sp. RSA 986]KAJ2212334.1 hypothetical protein EV179_004729 [Coemansia sp. RSA 487]KAJ2566682.1 hypothetical protein IW140_004805 [Coemansia sp. RSA 1813]
MAGEGNGLDEIYCPDKTCTNERDWLVHKPVSAAFWTLGSITLFLAIFYVHYYRPTRYSVYNKSIARMILIFLTVAMYARAALTKQGGNKEATYIASMVFNFMAAQGIYDGLFSNTMLVVSKFQPPSTVVKACFNFGAILQGWTEFALIVAGCRLMFYPRKSGSVRDGIRCIQAFLGIIMCGTFILAVFFASRFRSIRSEMSRYGIASSLIVFAMVQLWSTFMFARSFVQLDNVVRSSEALVVVLNYLPLIIAGISYLALGEPLSGKVDYSMDEDAQFADLEARIVALAKANKAKNGAGTRETSPGSDNIAETDKAAKDVRYI